MTTTALTEFLKARRSRLRPSDVGLPASARRRVPGLRREEVAHLAAISTDYYARLEQGRIDPSPAVLASLARALRLDEATTDYLYEVARLVVPPHPLPQGWPSTEQVQPVQAFLDDLTSTPAFVIGPRTEIIAWNRLGSALITDFAAIPLHQRYYVRLLITDPTMRRLYADWADVTRLSVEQLRAHNATNPDDPTLQTLVRELCALDVDFDRWWHQHDVVPRTSGTKVLHHPTVGELHLDWTALTWNASPGWQLIAWQALHDAPTQQRLNLLDQHARHTT